MIGGGEALRWREKLNPVLKREEVLGLVSNSTCGVRASSYCTILPMDMYYVYINTVYEWNSK